MLRLTLSKIGGPPKSVTPRKIVKYTTVGVSILGISYAFFHPKERKLLQSAIGSTVRFARCLSIGLTISVDYWISPLVGHEDTEVHQRAADRIVKGCLQNGGLYIKLGQGLAMLNHILPKEYVKSLSALQDKCLTRETNELEEMFLEDFGKRPEEVFREIEPEPVAAASLAQVFKGTTMDGDTVAIKVQYNDLQDRFTFDMKTLDYLLRIITLMHPKFNLHWVLNELFETLAQELDFEVEGKNGERCSRDLQTYEYAYIPKVYWNLSTKRILTTEWIDGIKINDTKAMKEQGIDIADVDRKLITLMAEQIFHSGFVHADPHPGNVLVRKDKKKRAQIVLLDHGLYEYLSEKTRLSLCNFWESMVLRDHHSLQKYAKDLNVEDYITLTEMLTQAPYSISLGSKMNDTSIEEYMVRQAQERFDKITNALRSMPKPMMLVIRNLNTIRAITKDHGEIVDRYRIMGRIAVRGRYVTKHRSVSKAITGIVSRMQFETRLWVFSFTQWLFKIYLNILKFLGYDVTRITVLLAG